MKRRSAEILRRLIDAADHALPVRMLLDDYRISEKTLRSDAQSISSFVRLATGEPVVYQADQCLRLADGADVGSVREMLDAMDLYDYRLSLEERKTLIVVELLRCAPEFMSMQDLADRMYVTRNTVVNDCKVVAEFLDGYGIELQSLAKRGLRIQADGRARCDILIDMFSKLVATRGHRDDFFSHFLVDRLGYACDVDDVLRLMRAYLCEHSTIIAHDAESEIAACLLVHLNETFARRDEDACREDVADGGGGGLPSTLSAA